VEALSSHPVKTSIAFFLSLLLTTPTRAQLLPSFGGSRTGTTGFQFLKIAPDARSVGVGESIIANTNDVSALFWNPAGITKVDTQKLHLQFSQTLYYADVNLSFAGAVVPVSKQTFLGVSFETLTTGEMPVTTEFQPFGTGQTFVANNLAVGLSLARILTENFSFGVTGKYVRESYAEVHAGTAVFDFGFQYEVGKANTRFAVGVSNFGFNTEPSGAVEVFSTEGTDTVENFESIAVPAVFRIGIAWDALKKTDHLLSLAGQLNHPTDNNETYGMGAEYAWKNLLYARTGYEFGLDETGMPNFGFGLRFKRNFGLLQLDYGFQDKSKLGSVHRITFGISFL
jgi:hypothetical protein